MSSILEERDLLELVDSPSYAVFGENEAQYADRQRRRKEAIKMLAELAAQREMNVAVSELERRAQRMVK
jgi:hypothetical protein